MALFGAHTTQHRTSGVFTGLLLGSIPSPGLRRPWEPSRETRGRVSSRSRSRPSVPGGAGGVGRRGRRTGTRRRPSAASWNRRRPCSRSRPTACRIPWLSLQHKAAVSGAGSDSLPVPLPPFPIPVPAPSGSATTGTSFRCGALPPNAPSSRVTWELGADTAALLAGTCSPQRREVQGGNCGAPSRRGGGGGSVALSPQASRQALGAHRSLPGHGSPGLPSPASAGTFPRGPLASAPPLILIFLSWALSAVRHTPQAALREVEAAGALRGFVFSCTRDGAKAVQVSLRH